MIHGRYFLRYFFQLQQLNQRSHLQIGTHQKALGATSEASTKTGKKHNQANSPVLLCYSAVFATVSSNKTSCFRKQTVSKVIKFISC